MIALEGIRDLVEMNSDAKRVSMDIHNVKQVKRGTDSLYLNWSKLEKARMNKIIGTAKIENDCNGYTTQTFM